jgi:hypothetical protein
MATVRPERPVVALPSIQGTMIINGPSLLFAATRAHEMFGGSGQRAMGYTNIKP